MLMLAFCGPKLSDFESDVRQIKTHTEQRQYVPESDQHQI